jgi:hypothetical protein
MKGMEAQNSKNRRSDGSKRDDGNQSNNTKKTQPPSNNTDCAAVPLDTRSLGNLSMVVLEVEGHGGEA